MTTWAEKPVIDVVNAIVWSDEETGFGREHTEMNRDEEFVRNFSVGVSQ